MLKKITFSRIIALLIAITFGYFFIQKITKTLSEKECLVAYDSYGYYMYLPHLFEKGHLNISKEWAEKRQYEYCDKSIPVYQLVPAENGNVINIYHMGLALVELPSYTLAHLYASWTGQKTDGFSTPFRVAFYLNALLFIFVGIYFLRRLLLLFFNDNISSFVLISIFFASNIFATYLFMYQLQHLYLFALNTMMLYFLFRYLHEFHKKHLLFSALIFGLTCFIRPTQALWGIIPMVLLAKEFGWNKTFWKKLLLYPLFAIMFNIPHVLYWKIIGGKLLKLNMHTEELILVDPNTFNFLFSFQKGWFVYSPIFLLIIPAFIYLFKHKRNLFWALFLFTILTIWVLSSWECWWYAASFGSRVMVDGYAVMALLIGFGLMKLWQWKISKWISFLFIFMCLPLNLLQTYQYHIGYLDYDRMTSQHYWYIFGKTTIENYNAELLKINRGDLNWPQQVKDSGNKRLKLVHKKLFNTGSLHIKPNSGLTVKRIRLLDLIPNDETLIEVRIVTENNDSTKSATLRMEMESKYNIYSWNSLEVALAKPKNTKLTQDLIFNLSPIRHRKDELHVFMDNKTDKEIIVHSIEVKSTTLVRH
jgi:hypothetical protein